MAFRVTPAVRSAATAVGAASWVQGSYSRDVSAAASLDTTLYDDSTVTILDIRSTFNAVMAGGAARELQRRMPLEWQQNDFSLVQKIVRDCVERVLTDPAIPRVSSTTALEAAYERSAVHPDIRGIFAPLLEAPPQSVPTVPVEDWNALVKEHHCALCLDVLAAPVIINCSHDFCGDCMNGYLRSADTGSEDPTCFCPLCRAEIESKGIYNRGLDAIIVKKVEDLPGVSDQSKDWGRRRGDYFSSRRGQKDATDNDDSEEDDLMSFRFINPDDYIKYAVFFASAAVVGVLIDSVMKHRRLECI